MSNRNGSWVMPPETQALAYKDKHGRWKLVSKRLNDVRPGVLKFNEFDRWVFFRDENEILFFTEVPRWYVIEIATRKLKGENPYWLSVPQHLEEVMRLCAIPTLPIEETSGE